MNPVVPFAKAALGKASHIRYHTIHAGQAATVRRRLKAVGLPPLDAATQRACREYAVEVLGGRRFAPWLMVYSVMAGEFRSGWIPDNYYGEVVVPARKGAHGQASEIKSLSRRLLDTSVLPDVAYAVNGLFLDTNDHVVPRHEVRDLLFSTTPKVVFKPDGGNMGHGIQIYTPETLPALDSWSENGVFQHFITQHPALGRFHPESVATLRITTVVTDSGEVSPRGAFMHFGSGSDGHVRAEQDVRVPVSLSDGLLAPTGHLVDWTPTAAHPDTKLPFEGAAVPAFEECVAVALRVHERVPAVRCIGWDLAVTDDERVVLLEWNGAHNAIRYHEATQGPCFADLGWEKLPRPRP